MYLPIHLHKNVKRKGILKITKGPSCCHAILVKSISDIIFKGFVIATPYILIIRINLKERIWPFRKKEVQQILLISSLICCCLGDGELAHNHVVHGSSPFGTTSKIRQLKKYVSTFLFDGVFSACFLKVE